MLRAGVRRRIRAGTIESQASARQCRERASPRGSRGVRVEEANGFAERRTALAMLHDNAVKERRITVAGDAGYDTADCVRDCRAINVTPHIAQTRDTR